MYSKAIRVTPEEETLMAMRLIRRNARNVPWITEVTLARKKAKLNLPCYKPENVKILLPVRDSGQQDFEGLLWGQRIWVPRPISNNKPKGLAKEENV